MDSLKHFIRLYIMYMIVTFYNIVYSPLQASVSKLLFAAKGFVLFPFFSNFIKIFDLMIWVLITLLLHLYMGDILQNTGTLKVSTKRTKQKRKLESKISIRMTSILNDVF